MEYSGFVEEYPCSASDIDRYASISDEDGKFWGSALPEHLRLPMPVIAPGLANPDVPIAPMTSGENDPLHSEVTPPQDDQFLMPNEDNAASSLHASHSLAPTSPAEPMGPMAPQSSSDDEYLALLETLNSQILPPNHDNDASFLDASYLDSYPSAPAIPTGSIGPISEQPFPLEEYSNFTRTINPPSFTPSLVDESSPSSLQSYASPSTNPAGSNALIQHVALTPDQFEQFQASNAFPTAIPCTTNFSEGCPPFLASDPWTSTNLAGSAAPVAVRPQRDSSSTSPYASAQYANPSAFSPQAIGTHDQFDARQFTPSVANGGQETTFRSSHGVAPQLPRHVNGIPAAAAGIVAPGPSSLPSQGDCGAAFQTTADVSQSVKTGKANGKRAAEPTEADQSAKPRNKKPRCMLGEDSAVDKHVLEWPHGKLQCLVCLNQGVVKVYERKDLYNLRRHIRGPHKIDPGSSHECTFYPCNRTYKHLSDLVKHQAKCKHRP
ncbi:hypothetical protein PtA15_4A727 [Puccinia triticina]|uniref:C2H2-type domain-containing protein n=1 Tax=Puccinia triticina TaxID=208348 RepID=A0ABY7CGP7_9BASI|nr:uncharacterized protein PtA15_4A727 [Puccinia triticina]WAQ84274.1 hypothetical protein PtA15_4A727 [Puccinia triticina]